jgi:dienelactone hydrolase
MRNLFFLPVLCLCLAFSVASAQQVFKTTSPSVIGYLEYLPQGYDTNSDKYPIMIFLHGIGERGVNSTDPAVLATTIQNVAKLGPPMYVKNGSQFPFILISPQLKNNYGSWSSSYVMEVINHVKTYLRVDERRIYLTGLSLGGGGTWVTAQDYPALFAAIGPVCGGYNSPSKACNIAGENLPVWAFHGDSDTTVPMSTTVNMVNAINGCVPAPSPLAKLTIYAGVKHEAWNRAYKTDHSVHNPNLYEWMMSYTNTTNRGNKIPAAIAGSDATVMLPNNAILSGNGTDTDGTIASYAWSQVSGPTTATLVNKLTKVLTAATLSEGKYVFRLTVTDNSGNTDSDYVTLTVQPHVNELPVASAGADKNISLPTNSVAIAGSGSDSDGTIATYEWTKVSGSTATLAGTTTSTLNATNLVSGPYVFRLTVTDNEGGTKSDEMTLTVTGSSPVANAGVDKTVVLPNNAVTLIGSGSDADGSISYYKWKKLSGPNCYLYGVSKPSLELSQMTLGTYSFRLTVTDNTGVTGYDDVTVTVLEQGSVPVNDGSNMLPIANAGSDKTLTLPTDAINITGSGTDADGTVQYYKWKKISGPYCYMYGVSKASLELSQMQAGTYKFSLTVTDNKGGTGGDEVTIVVKDGVTSAASLPTESVIADTSQEEVLGDLTMEQLQNSTVVIYNDAGKPIYSGNWNRESNHEILNKSGLYIYNVIREGRRMESGKIYVRN